MGDHVIPSRDSERGDRTAQAIQAQIVDPDWVGAREVSSLRSLALNVKSLIRVEATHLGVFPPTSLVVGVGGCGLVLLIFIRTGGWPRASVHRDVGEGVALIWATSGGVELTAPRSRVCPDPMFHEVRF